MQYSSLDVTWFVQYLPGLVKAPSPKQEHKFYNAAKCLGFSGPQRDTKETKCSPVFRSLPRDTFSILRSDHYSLFAFHLSSFQSLLSSPPSRPTLLIITNPFYTLIYFHSILPSFYSIPIQPSLLLLYPHPASPPSSLSSSSLPFFLSILIQPPLLLSIPILSPIFFSLSP